MAAAGNDWHCETFPVPAPTTKRSRRHLERRQLCFDPARHGVDPPSSNTCFRSVLPGAMIFGGTVSANTRNEKDFAKGINSIRARSYSVHMVYGCCGSTTRV
jgi:hypothetical protein